MRRVATMVTAALLMLGLVLGETQGVHAKSTPRWRLYDNFNSGWIDLNKWEVVGSGGQVTVVDGKAMMVLTAPNNKVSLKFKNPAPIKGIRAKVYIDSHTGGYFKARIGGYVAQTTGAAPLPVWQETGLFAHNNRIQSSVEVDDTEGNWLHDLFFNYFRNPIEVVGKWYTLTAMFTTPNKYYYAASEQGTCTFVPIAGTLSNGSKDDLLIGIKSKDDGLGVVYFDDVYIYK